MRLIDADALKHSIAGNVPLMPTVRIAIEHRIDEAPTIEAEPVKHGRWIPDDEEHQAGWICTNCYINACRAHIFCPNCGAMMDGGEDED